MRDDSTGAPESSLPVERRAPRPDQTDGRAKRASNPQPYAELHCHSAFSLLDGASSPEQLVERAHRIGLAALALTDHDDLGGAIRFGQAAAEVALPGIVGVELTVRMDGDATLRAVPDDARTASDVAPRAHLVLLAESRTGYGNISTLVTRARMDTVRGEPSVPFETVAEHAEGVFALTGCPRGWIPQRLAAGDHRGAHQALGELADAFQGRVAVEVWDQCLPEEKVLVGHLQALARSHALPWVVTNDVHYAEPRGRVVHDVLCALRHQRTLDDMGTRLRPNGEWHLRTPAAMYRRWRGQEEGLRQTLAIAERCAFRMDQLRPQLPRFPLPPGVTEMEYLTRLVEQGADERWGGARTAAQKKQLRHELQVIERLGFAGYFLIVWDIVRFARREGILCQGRGSAANSAVCYCLGITAVDPVKMELLFERFLSEERQEAPDIDLDFSHRERERVLQYVYDRYGREHAAMVCEQITYRGRSAVRDAARVLGFSTEQADALSRVSDRFSARATADALRVEAVPGEEPDEYSGDANSRMEAGVRGAGSREGTRARRARSRETVASSRHLRDAAKRALVAERLGQDMVRGTEATTRAREVREAARVVHGKPAGESTEGSAPSWRDPHAGDDHVERRNPVTATGGAAAAASGDAVLERAGLDPDDRRVRMLADVVGGLHQVPRHRSIHVGGFVLTREALSTVVPIEPASMPGRTVIQWEKDDLDFARLVKIDLLGLGMLTVLQDCMTYVRATRGVTLDLATLDMDDQAVYDDLCRADTIGVFQVESRAQMNTLPRLRPRCFYDLVVEVALIRPGPIQGDMVHPYLRRRAGVEEVTYPHPSLEPILRRTLGVPLFQEQGMQVAIACAGFTPGEADNLRRAMGHKRSRERMAAICEKLIAGMAANGIPEETARRIYNQINAFADYGFPESHAASFALLVYASAYLKHYYAPEFAAAILNAQPMGFYAPGTLIEDARRHGVRVRPVDLTRSSWDHQLELPDGRVMVPHDGRVSLRRAPEGNAAGGAASDRAGDSGSGSRGARGDAGSRRGGTPKDARGDAGDEPVLRLGLRLVSGLGARARERLEGALAEGPFTSIADVVRRTRLDRRALRALAEAGAFDSMVKDVPAAERRRVALWRVLEAERGPAGPLAPLPVSTPGDGSPPPPLPPLSPWELTTADYRTTGVSLNGHPMRHMRKVLAPNGVRTAREACSGRDGQSVAVAGMVICRQRPGTAKGFVFLTLEDETGWINVVVTPDRFTRQALLISTTPLLLVRGILQVESGVVNVRARSFKALHGEVSARSHDWG